MVGHELKVDKPQFGYSAFPAPCRSHPRYVLERHITRYQVLKPGTRKVGLHRGEAFYPRGALEELHTVRTLRALNTNFP